jgi:Uma2 family endonuclease
MLGVVQSALDRRRGHAILKRPATTKEIAMSTASVTTPALLTAEEFARRPDPGYPEELVRGRPVPMPMPMPKPRHGEICNRAGRILGNWADDHDLGRVLSNDTGVITERGPDTVRGADLSFYSYTSVPKGPLPDRYLDTPPELIVEVLSPSDRWPKVLAKVAEYLEAGTIVVLVLDDQRRLAHLYRADGRTQVLGAEEELTIPDLLGEFRVRVGRFFE